MTLMNHLSPITDAPGPNTTLRSGMDDTVLGLS